MDTLGNLAFLPGVPPEAENKTLFDSFYFQGKIEGKSPATSKKYDYVFSSFLKFTGNKALKEITPGNLKEYLYYLTEKNLSRSSIQTHFRVLKTFFGFLEREELLSHNPIKGIKEPKAPKHFPFYLNDEQVQKLLNSPNQRTYEGYRNYVMLLTFLDTGVRLSELAGLKLKDVNLACRSLQVTGKGDKMRTVYLGRKLTKSLQKWLQMRGYHPGEEAVFIDKTGERLKGMNIQTILKRTKRKAGITGIRCSPHSLRHTFATNYIRNGGDPFSLQQLLGHSDIKTVMIYVHMSGTALREAHAKFSPVDRMGG